MTATLVAARRTNRMAIRSAERAEARQMHALISASVDEGHLLPRTLDELTVHAERFVVATRRARIIGCAELASLSPQVAEVRSLAVAPEARGSGIGIAIVAELGRRARHEGFETLCAFTHAPAYFTQMGFSIVPHDWLTEKIATDCVKCPRFRQCGRYAMLVPINGSATPWSARQAASPAGDGRRGIPASPRV
jgi:amino-acid N-acetyltransferase